MLLPGWESLERTSAYARLFTYAGWAALFTLGVCEIISHVYAVHEQTLTNEAKKDRHLSAAQRDALTTRLRAREQKGAVDVMCSITNDESCAFAQELASALNDAGWGDSRVLFAAIVNAPVGVQLSQRTPGDALPHLNALYTELRAVGIDVDVVFEPSVPEGHAKLLVGTKP